jgi:hypothetical protein
MSELAICIEVTPSSGSGATMAEMLSPYRITPTIETLISDSSPWVVDGYGGQVLCRATGLRDAIERAVAISAAGSTVAALRRDGVVMRPDQITHFRKIIAGREVPAIKPFDHGGLAADFDSPDQMELL